MGKRVALLLAFLVIFAGAAVYAVPETAPAGVDATADTDGDGMPDWWEVKYFGQGAKFNKFNGKMDLDGDKLGAMEEYKLGTHPNDKKIDKNNDGVADDWMQKYGLTDATADADGDGASNIEEFEAATDPKDSASKPKEEGVVSQVHPEPQMDGVRDNLDKSIPENHEVKPNVFKFNDPIGDDKGPGYYQYPTNPVYGRGGFDILTFEVDARGKDNVVFKITVNADLKQDWGMAADFDVQHFQIYIDTDRVAGSGFVQTIPGLNILFHPDFAWDRVVMITPQPNSRVQIELDVKAKEFADNAVIPTKIVGQGRTIIATVKRTDLGLGKDDTVKEWAWQVIAQSNEGFPDPEDVLTRNVNEYRGLHRIGGGSDYWGDPEMVDMLVWPAMGSAQEAKDQFAILNIWESYPDPKLDIRAVLPMVEADSDMTEQWLPKGGYKTYAKELAAKIKPPAQKDKYVSDNFDLSTKMFTRWNWNLDAGKENKIRNSLEVQFFGKAFTDKVNFYMRWELADWEDTVWTLWNNSTPGQQPISLQSFRAVLVNPLPTVDTISLGNYELNYSPFVMGAAWYPDRDKFKGIFVDGTVGNILSYQATVHYSLNWIGLDFTHGSSYINDFTYGLKMLTSAIPNNKLIVTGALYTDTEADPLTADPKGWVLRGYNLAFHVDETFAFNIPNLFGFYLRANAAWSQVVLTEDFRLLEKGLEIDIDQNGAFGELNGGEINLEENSADLAATLDIQLRNMFNMGLDIKAQGFYIGYQYAALGADRGDEAFASRAGGSPTADILLMEGFQSVSRAPQAADFVASVPLPGLPIEFLFSDPVTQTKKIGWKNQNWEGVAAMGWTGGTVQAVLNAGAGSYQGEFSYITFNNPAISNSYMLRGFAQLDYKLNILYGLNLKGSAGWELGNDGMIASTNKGWNVIFPKFEAELQVSKIMTLKAGVRYDLASHTTTTASGSTNLTFHRLRFPIGFEYSMPVGAIVLKSEIWTKLDSQDFVNEPGVGAYAITEWEFGF